MDPRGRSCPLAYRYQPEALAGPAQLEADTLYVVGGLYGNLAALRAVLERADREPGGPAAIVFNGDFHWLDVDPEDFEAISETVLARHATKGNVEAELASDEDAGCGCAYPDYIGDDGRRPLQPDHDPAAGDRVAVPRAWCAAWASCPGTSPPASAGTASASSTATPSRWPAGGWPWRRWNPVIRWSAARSAGVVTPTTAADLLDWFGRADVECLRLHPHRPPVRPGGPRRPTPSLVINNGAAGLANFAGTTYGVITRLSSDPRPPGRQPLWHQHRRPALRRPAGAVRSCPMEGTLPGPMATGQPRPPLLLHPHRPRHPPAAAPGSPRRRPADRPQRAALSSAIAAWAAFIDRCRCIVASSHRHSSISGAVLGWRPLRERTRRPRHAVRHSGRRCCRTPRPRRRPGCSRPWPTPTG